MGEGDVEREVVVVGGSGGGVHWAPAVGVEGNGSDIECYSYHWCKVVVVVVVVSLWNAQWWKLVWGMVMIEMSECKTLV